MSQGRWIDGRLVSEVFVVNQTSGGGGGGGVTESEVYWNCFRDLLQSGIRTDVVPYRSGEQDLGSATKPWKDIYLTSGSIYLGESHLLFMDSDANLSLDNQPLATSGLVSGMIAAPKDSYSFIDVGRSTTVTLSARDGALIVTDPFTESISSIDLGATTPDPGNLLNVFIDGSGRYSVGASHAEQC